MPSDTSARERAQMHVERAAQWRDRAAADYAAANRGPEGRAFSAMGRAYERLEVAFEYLALAVAELSAPDVDCER